jgi:hypothetical protein
MQKSCQKSSLGYGITWQLQNYCNLRPMSKVLSPISLRSHIKSKFCKSKCELDYSFQFSIFYFAFFLFWCTNIEFALWTFILHEAENNISVEWTLAITNVSFNMIFDFHFIPLILSWAINFKFALGESKVFCTSLIPWEFLKSRGE